MGIGNAETSSVETAPAQPCTSTGRLLGALVCAILALAPFGYLGILAGVAVHEVIGHGLTSLAVGGEFLGFQLDFDGMGYAIVPLKDSTGGWRRAVVLSGGVVATFVFGLALFLGGYGLRRRPWAALPLIIVSFGLLMDGIPYIFWNALKPVPPGDVGKVIEMTGSSLLRVVLIVVGGLSMIAITWAFTTLLFAILQSWLSVANELQNKARLLLLALIGVISGIAWFTFDWNQLVPGIGFIPSFTGLILHLAAAASLLLVRPRLLPLGSTRGIGLAALVGWGLAGISIAAIATWFRQGIFFFA
jgi:hypothetical protein